MRTQRPSEPPSKAGTTSRVHWNPITAEVGTPILAKTVTVEKL